MVVPIALVTEVMDPLVRERMSWDAEALQLRVDTSEPNVSAVLSGEEDATIIEVRTARELPCWCRKRIRRKKGRRVVARIPNGVLVNKLIGTFPGKGDVEKLEDDAVARDGDIGIRSARRMRARFKVCAGSRRQKSCCASDRNRGFRARPSWIRFRRNLEIKAISSASRMRKRCKCRRTVQESFAMCSSIPDTADPMREAHRLGGIERRTSPSRSPSACAPIFSIARPISTSV